MGPMEERANGKLFKNQELLSIQKKTIYPVIKKNSSV
jgi:hypothetical protein